jgi:hypothetical protein
MNEEIPREVFRSLLDLVMCSDPSPLSGEQDRIIRDWLDQESRRRGYSDWIDALHRMSAWDGVAP